MKWDSRSLLLLGLLMSQSQHGYQINEFIERNLNRVTNMKKSTAYTILDRLCAGGYVAVTQSQEGNRPVRKVYSITETGSELFIELLRSNLATEEQITFDSEIGLMFLDHLERSDVIKCLTRKKEQVRGQLSEQEAAPPHGFGVGVDLAMHHHRHMLQSELDWLERAIHELGRA